MYKISPRPSPIFFCHNPLSTYCLSLYQQPFLQCYILYLLRSHFLPMPDHSPLSSLSLYFPHYPLLHSPPFPPLSPSSLSLPLCAQDRSALITLTAMMIQLNGPLSPQCLCEAALCCSSSSSSSDRSLGSVSVGTMIRWTSPVNAVDVKQRKHNVIISQHSFYPFQLLFSRFKGVVH